MIKTTCYEIFDYWKERTFPSGELYDRSKPNQKLIVLDWGELTCFACNAFFGDCWENGKQLPLKKFWNRPKGLQRCHIIADAAGGSDSPDNLLLLCPFCHDAMPKLNDRKIVFKWAAKQEKQGHKDALAGVKEAQQLLSIPDKYMTNVLRIMNNDELSSLATKHSKATSHMAQMAKTPGGYTRKSLWFELAAEAWLWYKDNKDYANTYMEKEKQLLLQSRELIT